MQKIVITGATSFLGRYIVAHLQKRANTQIYTVIRPTSKQLHLYDRQPNVIPVIANMDDPAAWTSQIGKANAFIHLGWDGVGAAGRNDPDIQNKNIRDAIGCMEGAAALGCSHFLFAGSQAEYGPQTGLITEQTPCAPVILYGKAKLSVCNQLTALAKQLGITYYHTRIFSVYGTGDHPWTLVSSCIRTFCAEETMRLSHCTQFWNFMYAPDAARDICALLFSGADSGIYHIASRDTRILKDFVSQIHRLCGNRGSREYGLYTSIEKPVSLQPDVSRLTAAIGFLEETPFDVGIGEMVHHYETTGEL